MKKVSEFRRHAEECRELATRTSPEHRDMLLKMAETWDALARNRERMAGKKQASGETQRAPK
jgi:hypothetical protein